MAIRQEQIVLLGTTLLLGYFAFGGSSGETRSRRSSTKAPEFEDHFAPDVSRALPLDRDASSLNRELFSAPTDTRPFPKLEFESPLLEPLEILRPVPVAGPRPSLMGQFLRRAKTVSSTPDLFLSEGSTSNQDAADEFAQATDISDDLLTAEERRARIAGYRASYDWIDIGRVHYGYIRNPNRFGLAERPAEGVLFVEVNPATGREVIMSQSALTIDRERVKDFGFADTLDNRIELERLEFAGDLTVGQYPEAILFARTCLLQRNESSRALEVAAEIYAKADAITVEDPEPKLGLAACAEALFDFETAFGIYRGLVDGKYSNHPLVLARLAQLEERFRLTEQARAHFEQAQSFGRTTMLLQWQFGQFLLAHGEPEAAREHLKLAVEFEPKQAQFQELRGRLRTSYGDVLVAVGELDAARGLYERALQADEGAQNAIAGLMNVDYLQGKESSVDGSFELQGTGFDLLVAEGLRAIEQGDFEVARSRLESAAETDPIRAYCAWRALSYLAEITGNESEALAYIDRAEANDPTDVYSLYQRGRILAQNGDVDEALASLKKALDLELDLADALAVIGRIEMLLGNHEDAERFLERATQVDPRLASAFTMRGLNILHMGRPSQARDQFDQALVLSSGDPVAAIGNAWCAYFMDDPIEAKTLLREFEDSRRGLGEEDPYRVYAKDLIDRIGDWEEKVVWTDRFERQDIRNGWKTDESSGPKIFIRSGKIVIEGDFDKSGRTRLKRNYTSGDFVSLEAQLTINPGSSVRVGLFVALEQRRGARTTDQVTSEVTLSRHGIEKRPQYRSMRRRQEDEPYVDSTIMDWKDGQTVTLLLERYGESSKTAFRVSIDGVLIAEDVPMPALGATTREIVVGIFAEGEPGRAVHLEIDDVVVVKRQR